MGRRWFVLEKLWAASVLRITTTFCNKKFREQVDVSYHGYL
jgi:hypothetical protein